MTQTPQTPPFIEHPSPDMLNAFVDHELSPAEQEACENHLAICHACTLRFLSATQLKAATANAGQRFSPSPEAFARITAQLQPQPETKKRAHPTQSFRVMAWSALAAGIVLAVSFLGWRQLHSTNALSAELLDQHLAMLSTAATPQVVSTDRHTVKPWFQGRLPFSFNLPDTAALPPETTLKGADLTYLNNQPAALLLFTIGKHNASVFLMQKATNPDLMTLPGTRAGFNVRTATTQNLRILAVSDVNPANLDLLVKVLTQAQAAQN